jgi:hypothetical protein
MKIVGGGGSARRVAATRGLRLLAVCIAACTLWSAGCPGSPAKGPDAAAQASTADAPEVSEWIYDAGLSPAWHESGSAAREPAPGAPARVRFGETSEWVLTRPGLGGHYGALVFRVKEPPGEGEFLEVRVGSNGGSPTSGVKLKPEHRTDAGDGWAQMLIPMAELDPNAAPFDRLIFRTFRPFAKEWVLFDKIGLTKSSGPAIATNQGIPYGKPVHAKVSCDGKQTAISPLIYGIAFGDKGWPTLRPTARRFGGNPTTRYNWQNGFSNGASDWFFENRGPGQYKDFIAENAANAVQTAFTIPMIGWVAKDGTSYGFPVSVYGPQQKTDPWRSDAGNGVSPSGKNITPNSPTQTSVAAPPAFMGAWVAAITAAAAQSGKRNVYEYILDNEPWLWNTTHRDVHPEPVGYDELLDKTIQYASAIRAADPQAVIAGPAEWGWTGYMFSAKDVVPPGLHLDRRAHGDVPLVEWYLQKVCEHEKKTGTRILDVLDLHYYPQGANVYGGGQGGTDAATQRLRLRSTRSLWDPKYVDESWIGESVRLLPRMKEWVDKNCPGRGISIGEWNFGGESDITGALSTAEALGRFAQFGVTSAFYWTAPNAGTPSSFAFLAYRNFDGRGGHFLDWYVPTTTPDNNASVFASRDAEGGKHLVLVALNLSQNDTLATQFDLASCGAVASHQSYSYQRGSAGLAASAGPPGGGGEQTFTESLPPWSITVMDVHLQ